MSELDRSVDAWAYGPGDRRPQRVRRRWSVPAAATALVLLAASVALADVIVADGDGLEPVSANPLNFGEVCVGRTVERTVKVAAVRERETGLTAFADGSTVEISIGFVFGGPNGRLAVALEETTIDLPSTWQSFPAGTTSAPVNVSATMEGLSPGVFSGFVFFDGTGVNGNDQVLSVTTSLPVTAQLVECPPDETPPPEETPPGNQPPVLDLPGDLVVEGNTIGGAFVTFAASASDPEDGALEPECSKSSGDHFPLGTTTVSCWATDSVGESVGGSFAVTVVDTIPPQLKDVPGDATVTATTPTGAVVDYQPPTAEDVVDPDPVVSCTPEAGTLFAPGTTQVTCTASDASGNASSASFLVTVSFDWVGFLPPYDTGRAEVRAGSTVPVKWRAGDGAGGWIASLDLLELGASGVQPCGESLPVGNLAQHATGETWLRTAGGQFVYNWKVPSEPGACYQVRVALADGTSHIAQFRIR